MKTGVIILHRDGKAGSPHVWEVYSISLGATGQEGLVELRSLTHRPGYDVDDQEHHTTWVPEALLRKANIYTPVPRP